MGNMNTQTLHFLCTSLHKMLMLLHKMLMKDIFSILRSEIKKIFRLDRGYITYSYNII